MRAAFALAGALSLLAACKAGGENTHANPQPPPAAPAPAPVTDVTDEHYAMPPLPKAHVVLTDMYGGKHDVEVEVAATDKARTRGLMWRRDLAKGKGMLFLFQYSEVHGFWMRNTLIPLDMVFIGEDMKIAGIVQNAEPRTLVSRNVGVPSKYVLELPGGWTEELGLRAGLPVEFRGTSMIPTE